MCPLLYFQLIENKIKERVDKIGSIVKLKKNKTFRILKSDVSIQPLLLTHALSFRLNSLWKKVLSKVNFYLFNKNIYKIIKFI